MCIKFKKGEKINLPNKLTIMTKDWLLALLFTIIITLIVWINLESWIFRLNTFQIICLILILIILTFIFWKRIKYFVEQFKSFLIDVFVVWFLSILVSLTFITSYRLYRDKCVCMSISPLKQWILKCLCDTTDLLLDFFSVFIPIYLLRFFLLIFLLPSKND